MSPGIRSGVNCTRLVSDRERGRQAAHQQRLGDARARPPSARARRRAARRAGRTRRRPGRRRPWPPRRARQPGARGRRRRPSAGSVGLVRTSVMGGDTSLSSSASCRARSARSLVVGGWRRRRAEQGVDLVDAAAGVRGDAAATSAPGRCAGGRPRRSASRARAADRSAVGGVARGRRPGGRGGRGLRVVSTALTATGSGSTASGPSRRPRHTHEGDARSISSSQSAGREPAGAGGRTGRRRRRRRGRRATGRTRPGGRRCPSSRSATAALSPVEDLVVGEGRRGAEQREARPRLGEQHTAAGAEAAVGRRRPRPRAPAAPARRTPGSRRRPGRPARWSRRTPPMSSWRVSSGPGATTTSPASPWCASSRRVVERPSWSDAVTTTRVEASVVARSNASAERTTSTATPCSSSTRARAWAPSPSGLRGVEGAGVGPVAGAPATRSSATATAPPAATTSSGRRGAGASDAHRAPARVSSSASTAPASSGVAGRSP